MQIGAVSFQPYIYNTSTVNSASMKKISPISEDLFSGKTDFSGLVDEQENINPLRKGESANFTDILSMQLHMSQMNANRIMGGTNAAESIETFAPVQGTEGTSINNVSDQFSQYQMSRGIQAYAFNMAM